MNPRKAKVTQIGMEQGRVSRENVQASSQFEDEEMLSGELNTLCIVKMKKRDGL
jgi:hypothetical protein